MTKNRRQSKKKSHPQPQMSPGSFDVPAVCLNPKRRYTVRMLLEAGHSGSLNYTHLADGLFNQITTLTASALPPAAIETPKPWKFIRFISARAWGQAPVSGKTTVPVKLQLASNIYNTVPPSSTFVDVAAGTADRGFDHIKGTSLSWYTIVPGNVNVIGYQNVSILDADVEVW
jgi:hypothetical protein